MTSLRKENTMGKFLVASVAIIVVVGGVALYTTTKGPAAALAGAQPINSAIISVEELEGKNRRIEELQAEVAEKDKIYSATKVEKERAEEALIKRNYEAIDLKDRISNLEKENIKLLKEASDILQVYYNALNANKLELQKTLKETERVLLEYSSPRLQK